MRIAIGCDHRARDLKGKVIGLLTAAGHEVSDLGCHSDDAVDYPDVAGDVAAAVSGGAADRGILICGTGIGMSIAANKWPGIRAALCHDVFGVSRSRLHNDANVLCLGAEVAMESLAGAATELLAEMLDTFVTTGFEGGRHQRRLDKIAASECPPAAGSG